MLFLKMVIVEYSLSYLIDVNHNAEGIVTEIIHGVSHLFHDVEERVKAYVPASIGTYLGK